MRPVSSGEIRKFLTSCNLSFAEGFTCIVTTCPRHSRRKLKLKELDKLYVNTKTGRCCKSLQNVCIVCMYCMCLFVHVCVWNIAHMILNPSFKYGLMMANYLYCTLIGLHDMTFMVF